ncbi:MAG: hypothetical protein A3F09_03120 [Chlamydiae bacterium RIFCSPHIGHO2_12_FULL_49_11]|nr:MAG: hypothetical protein A3F09_03120 [Chlamydiae bacterium RIFCSPHIGHO2_12_FULL_49_11]
MTEVKYTKNEYLRLQTKHAQLVRYLPTLQLKKMLLQLEVNRADEEITAKVFLYEDEKDRANDAVKLLSYPFISEFLDSVRVDRVVTEMQNIAGVEIPSVKEVVFKPIRWMPLHQPIWMAPLMRVVEKLQKLYREILVLKEKKKILAAELRTVSIRVNLFEKRLIPELVRDMNTIKVFIDDAALQAVCQAKVAKEKIEGKEEVFA